MTLQPYSMVHQNHHQKGAKARLFPRLAFIGPPGDYCHFPDKQINREQCLIKKRGSVCLSGSSVPFAAHTSQKWDCSSKEAIWKSFLLRSCSSTGPFTMVPFTTPDRLENYGQALHLADCWGMGLVTLR